MIEGVKVLLFDRHRDTRGWLIELFRIDEIDYNPVMSYASLTLPDQARGPHEHHEQTDYFCFFDSTFELKLWDNRSDSLTYGESQTLLVGSDYPCAVFVPPGVVHLYKNVGAKSGLVVNFPDKLYRGVRKSEEVDEIRHEDDPDTRFK